MSDPELAPVPAFMTERLARWRRLTDWPLMVLAVGSLPILLLEVERESLIRSDRVFVGAVNVVVLTVFLADYVVGVALAGRRWLYVRREWASLLIVVAQAVALVPVFAAFGVLRALRAARLFRFIAIAMRAAAIGGTAASSGRQLIREHTTGLAFGIAGLTWLTSASAFTVAEDVGTNGRLDSYGDALWWSLSTITTVGYGDVYPVTASGRVIAGFTMVIGVSVFALITAKIAQFLVHGHVKVLAGGQEKSSRW
jgi:voltage-gated potassium channel